MNLKKLFWKSDKIWQFLNKNTKFKNENKNQCLESRNDPDSKGLVDPDPDPGRPKSSVVDPDADRDPVGSETFSRIRIWIRIQKKIIPDPGSSGSEIKCEKLLWKTDKIWQVLNKNTKFKNEIPFSKQVMDRHSKPTD
jgi:hypothetical protein